jgi:hypothetical protein
MLLRVTGSQLPHSESSTDQTDHSRSNKNMHHDQPIPFPPHMHNVHTKTRQDAPTAWGVQTYQRRCWHRYKSFLSNCEFIRSIGRVISINSRYQIHVVLLSSIVIHRVHGATELNQTEPQCFHGYPLLISLFSSAASIPFKV